MWLILNCKKKQQQITIICYTFFKGHLLSYTRHDTIYSSLIHFLTDHCPTHPFKVPVLSQIRPLQAIRLTLQVSSIISSNEFIVCSGCRWYVSLYWHKPGRKREHYACIASKKFLVPFLVSSRHCVFCT